MFCILKTYLNDPWAAVYATQMHSDSGYLVTDGSGKASYGGYLTWDDHPGMQPVRGSSSASKAAPAKKHHHAKAHHSATVQHCRPFGCPGNID